MDNFQNFKNALFNLESGWTGTEAFKNQKEILLSQKKLVLKNKKVLQKEGYNVIDIYKQIDEFDNCIKRQLPITDDYEEKILLAALEYANSNRPIIYSVHNKNLFELNSLLKDSYYIELPKQRYKYDVSVNLIAFYLSYREQFEVFEAVKSS